MVDGPDRQVNLDHAFIIHKEVLIPKDEPSRLLLSRYPIVSPRDKCAGDLGQQPGVRSYGLRPADERYDVYCYIDGIKGHFECTVSKLTAVNRTPQKYRDGQLMIKAVWLI